jgi:hypothetical protein
MLLYMGVAYWTRYARSRDWDAAGNEFMLAQLFNAVTFAGSLAIIWGVIDPAVMEIIGDATMFLLVAGLAGLLFSIRELARPFFEKRYP